ncbi:MAG: enoyl-CoA hydratase/isomerase family protein [Deltaproteobacteria bacterium]|nr:enoyl-CoA hydratase/isomerase family protein [Candidatus Tharpella aukensis]
MQKTVTIEKKDGCARLRLNQPKKANVYSPEMAIELWDAVRSLRWDDEVKAVLLEAEGPIFSGGGDLLSFKQGLDQGNIADTIEKLSATLNSTVLALRRMDKIFVSLVDGICAGAGVGLALAADISLATENALFVAGYIGIGAVPDGGSSFAVIEALGRPRAADFFLTNGRIDGTKAAEIGLVSRFVKSSEAQEAALELVHSLSRGPRRAQALTKGLLSKMPGLSLTEHLENERQGIIASSGTRDFGIGVNAFLKKEKLEFCGE